MDLKNLNNKIDEINIPITTIAEKIGISRQSLYLKLSGLRDFKVSEINSLCDILRLTNEEKSLIFFTDKVDKSDN
jgi:predicted transcriptional regulator